MYYNFIYPDIRVNPDYRFDEVMSGYNYNFSIINNWQYSGATIGGVILSGGSVIATSISATTYLGLPSSTFTGGTVSGPTTFTAGLTATSISATTYLGLPSSTFTGGTINGPTTFTAGLTTTSISATTYLGLPSSNFSGGTINGPTTFTAGLTATSISATTYLGLPTDIRVTGGTYSNGTATFRNNTGGTFSVTGFTNPFTGGTVDGLTATSISATTYYGLPSSTFTGGTVAGLTATSISATTYLGLPTDIRVTGGTYANGTATFTNNTGGTFSVTGFTNPFTGGTVAGLTATSISATTYLGLPTDIRVTGGTYANGTATFTNNTGGTFSVTGFTNPFTGGTVTGLTATSISATTYLGLPTDIRVTGGTYANGTATFTNNTGGTFSVTGFTNPFTGGTVSGPTTFTAGLTATSISATTYYGLPSTSGLYLPLSGGTVFGPTTFTSGVTTNYIDFDTTPTVTNPTGGTLYFDSNENALSYKPLTNQNDVTVNLGQESLIRIYNNLGYQINNGQVLHITGSTSGVSTVALANASKIGTIFTESLAQTSGVATHNIPNGEYGFMTNFGVVRGLNTSGFTVGQEVFLSDTVDGGLTNNPYSIAFTSRISVVGYCLESNSTNGKILVDITNENNVQSLTQLQLNVLLGNTISTGVFNFTGITLASSNTFNVAPVDAWIINNTTNPLHPEVLYVSYSGQTNIPSLYYSSATETYLLLTSAATLTQQTTFPTSQQRRQNVYLGKIAHGNRTSLINAFNEPDLDVSPLSQLRDMFTPIKLINENVYPAPNTGLTFNTSSGTLWGLGIGFINNQLNPSSLSISGNSPTTFQYRTQTGGTATNRTTIDPANYDLNGTITSIGSPAKQATNQRIFLLQNGQVRIQYGQTKYSDLTTAIAAVNTELFTTFSNFRDNAILIAILSIRSDATLLSDALQAKITFASKFGESVGGTGGISTTTLQQAYNNSAQPEIVTNSAEGALSIKNGTGNVDNVTNLFEGINTAGNTTSFVRADGYISAATVQTGGVVLNSSGLTATSISATTYLGLPTDIKVTGGTYSAGTATFANNTGGTFSVTGFTNPFTGGTVVGLTATSISATTYYGLPTDIRVTGGTYSNGTATFTNNTGGTFSVTGFTNPFTGGTVAGPTTFTVGLTATSISASSISANTITLNSLPTTSGLTNFLVINNDGSVAVQSLSGGSSGSSLNTFTTGATFSGNTIIFNRNDIANAYSLDFSQKMRGSFGLTIDGSNSVITTGQKGYAVMPYDGIINGWSIVSDQPGSCVIDVWKSPSGIIPTSIDTITGTERPTLSSQQINSNLSLTSWTSSISFGDVVAFNVDSASTITRVNLTIYIIKQ